MSQCKYDLSKDCNNKDCLNCEIDKIRADMFEMVRKMKNYNSKQIGNILDNAYNNGLLAICGGLFDEKDVNECYVALRIAINILRASNLTLDDNVQELKTGHWIEGRYKDTCSHCRCTYPKDIGFKNYCPNCGTRMVEQQESGE